MPCAPNVWPMAIGQAQHDSGPCPGFFKGEKVSKWSPHRHSRLSMWRRTKPKSLQIYVNIKNDHSEHLKVAIFGD